MAPRSFLLSLLVRAAMATDLLTTHYSGDVSRLSFSRDALTLRSRVASGSRLPSWVTYDNISRTAFVADEVHTDQRGSLNSFHLDSNGSLVPCEQSPAAFGAVAITLYGGATGRDFIANAHYFASQLSTFKLPLDSKGPMQTLNFTMNGTGPIPDRQEMPHPHHVFPDPTGNFLVVTDLGADLFRIARVDKSTGKLTQCPPVQAIPGSGPRHGAFWIPPSNYSSLSSGSENGMLFVANELTSTVSAWSVAYPKNNCLSLSLKQTLTAYQGNKAAAPGVYVGEIRVKGDHLYLSNRNDTNFAPHDSITRFSISPNGTLAWADNTSSYGVFPRTFDINQSGDFVAIGNQVSSNVAMVARDPVTGILGDHVADFKVGPEGTPGKPEGLSSVVWAE